MYWWLSFLFSSSLNLHVLYNIKPETQEEKYSKLLSSLFILSTTVRAIFPRIDVERICYFNSFVSSTFIGRSLATIGEVSFALQLSLYLLRISKNLKITKYNLLLYLFPIFVTIAQGFCWVGVITKKQIYHCIEETIWMCSVAFLIIPTVIEILGVSKESNTQTIFIIALGLIVVYVVFMAYIDIPMYYRRYLKDEKGKTKYLTFSEGLYDCMSCNIITKKWSDWKEDYYWMFGYFSISTLLSIVIIKSPLF